MKRWLAVLLAMLLVMGTCVYALADKDDSKRFAQEYEAENGSLDGTGLYVLPELDLADYVPFDYEEFDDVVELLTEDTGVLYLGFPTCPWCRALIPALIDAWNLTNSKEEITYYNIHDLRPVRSLDEEGNVITEKEADPKYDRLVELMYDHLRPFEGSNDESIKHIYVPMVVFVRNGNIEYAHIGTVDGHERGETMTDEEYNGLVQMLAEHMDGLLIDD